MRKATSKGAAKPLRSMRESPDDDDDCAQEPQEDDKFEEWASQPSTSKEDVLMALGKGRGKGAGKVGKGYGRGNNGGQQTQRQNGQRGTGGPGNGRGLPPTRGQAQPTARADPPPGNKEETRRCFNCDEYGHLGKDCPMPDRRKTGNRQGQQARSLTEVDDEGFSKPRRLATMTESKKSWMRLCTLRARTPTANSFATLSEGHDHIAPDPDDHDDATTRRLQTTDIHQIDSGSRTTSTRRNDCRCPAESRCHRRADDSFEDAFPGWSSAERSTARQPLPEMTTTEFPDVEQAKTGKATSGRRSRMQAPRPSKRESQSVSRQANRHDNACRFVGMSGMPYSGMPDYPTASTTTSTTTTTIDEPPQVPEGATRVKRKPWERRRRPTGRVFTNPCSSSCGCEHGVHPDEHESDSEEPSHGLADSDDEEDVPDKPTALLSSRQRHRRETRLLQEKRDAERQILLDAADRRNAEIDREIDEEIARMIVPDPRGSSTRSPVAADDDRCDGTINNDHASGNRPVETPSPAESCPGSFQIADLFGPTTTLASGGRQIGSSSPLFFFKEKPQLLAAATETRWEKVTLTVDSGASDTVVPPTVAPGAPLQKSDRVGIEYEIADGHVIENLGEKHCLTKFSDDNAAPMLMNFQVVDVSKALLSVHRVTEQGHDVQFSTKNGNYIYLNGDRSQKLELRHVGGTYELDVWVKPSPPFGGQR